MRPMVHWLAARPGVRHKPVLWVDPTCHCGRASLWQDASYQHAAACSASWFTQ
jgi:hypothetical protein